MKKGFSGKYVFYGSYEKALSELYSLWIKKKIYITNWSTFLIFGDENIKKYVTLSFHD